MFSKIKIHTLTWILIAISLLSARFIEIIIMFFIVFVHEMGHAFMAQRYKWDIRQIRILPFGGEMETDAFGCKNFAEEFLVIIAGPMQHVFLFLSAYILNYLQMMPDWIYVFFQKFNLMILISNLYPALPLDGGRLLFLLFAKKWPFVIAHRRIMILSSLFAFSLIVCILLLNPTHVNSWLFSLFISFSIFREWKHRHFFHMRFLLSRNNEEKIIKKIVVRPDEKLMNISRKFYKNRKHEIVVKKGNQIIGIVTEVDLIKNCFYDKKPFEKVGNLL
ncbi:MAG: stage sporulation protein [Bacillales bacterium]|nr:stage sporulation protein [Bacillales bacterium]